MGARGDCVLSAPVTVHAYPSPFKPGTRFELETGADLTVDEIIDEAGFPRSARPYLRTWIQGCRVPRHMWKHTRPNPGTVVSIKAVPRGGDQGKAIANVVIGVALLAAALVAGYFYTLIGATIPLSVYSAAFAGASLITSGAFSLASPPPAVPFAGEIPTSDSRAIAAPRNEARPFAPVPRVFGRYRVFPQYAAKPYTEIVGNDSFLRLLFTFGYGPLLIEDLKIGEDLVENFADVEFNILPGYDDDPELALFTAGVDEDSFQIQLEPHAGTPEDPLVRVVRTSRPDTHESSIDLIFPTGLIAFDEDDGSPRGVTAFFTVEYRVAGSSDPWTGVTATAPLGPGVSNPAAGELEIAARERGLVARGIRWVYPSPGQWEVRISRNLSQTSADLGTLIDECNWTVLRSIRPGTKPRVPNLCLLELRIRATDQLAGVIQNLSAMCTSILPVWNSIDGWGPDNRDSGNGSLQATREPAWCLAEMLRGGVNARPVPDENIDTTSLAAWAISNAAEGRTFDAVVDFETTVAQVCRDIAGAHRASFNVIDGRYGVVVDEPKPVIVAQFSDRDTGGFSGAKVFRKEVHALRVRFVSPDAGYEPDERIVYADGYDEANATEFGELDLWGVTDPDIAWKDGRYHLANSILRPEIYSFELDFSHLMITRGDRVLYSHDVMLVGLGAGRIRELFNDGGGDVIGFRVDEEIDYDPAKSYAARFRFADGHSELHNLANLGTVAKFLVLQTAMDPGDAPAVDDMVAWGESGKETGDFIVHSITPTSDLRARVELLDYSEAIFNSDTGEIPPFDPNITDPRPRIVVTPSKPIVDAIRSDESVLLRDPDGTFRPRILITARARQGDDIEAEFLQAQYRTSSPVGEWYSAPQVSAKTSQISVENVDEGEAYDLRVRAISGGDEPGRASAWVTVFGHVVVGASTPPPGIENLRVDPGEVLVWDYPSPPRDFAGFKVRHQAGSDTLWTTAIPAHDGLVTESRFSLSGLPPGQRTILVKAVDTAGNESTDAAFVVSTLIGAKVENIVETEDFHAGGFAGTKTNATVEGGSGDLVADSEDTTFWGAPGNLFWGAPGNLFWGDSFQAMAYEDEWTPPGTAIPGRLRVTLTAQGAGVRLRYRIQGSSVWLPWPGYIDAQASTTYEFRVDIDGVGVRGRIEAFAAYIDRPDIEEFLEDVVIADSGTVRLSLTQPFVVIKQVLWSVQDDGNGATGIVVLDKDAASGPSVIAIQELVSNRVQGLSDFRVRGY